MIETLAAHKVALMLGLALLGAVLVIRARGAAASTAAAGIPVNPYSSTPPPSLDVGGALSLPSASPYQAAASGPVQAADSTGTSGPGTSASTGPGAGPTVATPTLPAGSLIDPNTGTTTNLAGYPTNTSYADLGLTPDPISGPAPAPWIHGPAADTWIHGPGAPAAPAPAPAAVQQTIETSQIHYGGAQL